MPGWDPAMSLDQTVAAFHAEAVLRYGEARAQELEPQLRGIARDVWTVAQQQLDHTGPMPDVMLNPEDL